MIHSNSGNKSVPLSVAIESSWNSVNGTTISTPDPLSFNFKNNQTAIVPKAALLGNSNTVGGVWSWNVPAYSINVLQFDV